MQHGQWKIQTASLFDMKNKSTTPFSTCVIHTYCSVAGVLTKKQCGLTQRQMKWNCVQFCCYRPNCGDRPDEHVVGNELHLLGVEDAVKSSWHASFGQLGQPNANQHLLEAAYTVRQRHQRPFCARANKAETCRGTHKKPYRVLLGEPT